MSSQVPKGYRQTEVGIIPEDWEVETFGSLFTFQNGVNADKSSYGQGVSFINVLEPITYSHIYGPEIQGKVTLPKTALASYSVQCGDVLFNRTSEVQEEVGLASTYLGAEQVVFGGFVIRGRPTGEDFCPIYSGYALRAAFIRSQIIPLGQGAIRANIGQQSLRLVFAPVPPFLEQCAIASTLSDIDNLLASLDQLIAKKRDLKQATMQQLLTGKKRLPGFEEEWIEKKLGEIADKIVGGGTPSRSVSEYWNGDVPWMTVKDFSNYSPFKTIEYISKRGLEHSASNLIPKNTLIVSTRMALGKCVIPKVDMSINQDLKAIFTPKDIDCLFLYYWFCFSEEEIFNLGSGSTVMGISLPDLKSIRLHIPPLPEQTAIAKMLSDIDTELTTLETRRTKTQALKQAMMQQLLTGQTRLI